jgi:hypothetical protein
MFKAIRDDGIMPKRIDFDNLGRWLVINVTHSNGARRQAPELAKNQDFLQRKRITVSDNNRIELDTGMFKYGDYSHMVINKGKTGTTKLMLNDALDHAINLYVGIKEKIFGRIIPDQQLFVSMDNKPILMKTALKTKIAQEMFSIMGTELYPTHQRRNFATRMREENCTGIPTLLALKGQLYKIFLEKIVLLLNPVWGADFRAKIIL